VHNWINILAAADYGVYVADAESAIIKNNSFTQSGGACVGIYLAAAATNATVWPNFLDAGVTNTIVDSASLKVNSEHQIPIVAGEPPDTGWLVNNAGWETSGPSIFSFDPALYPPIVSVKMRAMMNAGAHPALVHTKLYNTTHAADVTGATCTTLNHAAWENITSSDFKAEIPTGEHDYALMYAIDTNNGYLGKVVLVIKTN
jgi:hypothetical protein